MRFEMLHAASIFPVDMHSSIRGLSTASFMAFVVLILAAWVPTITAAQSNSAPVAEDDAYLVNEGDTLRVFSPGVLINDTDADNDDLIAILEEGPTNGELLPQGSDGLGLTLDGAFTYVPNPDFWGVDQFTYAADDGTTSSDLATVVITVNGRPIAEPDAYTVNENSTLEVAAPGVLENDSDPEGDELTATVVSLPMSGTLSSSAGDNLIDANGSFNYSPAPGFSGEDEFTYFASDLSGGRDTTTVTLTVMATNSAPIAEDDTYLVNESDTLQVFSPGVLTNDTDPDNDNLIAILEEEPANGELLPQGSDGLGLTLNGAFTYVPNPGFRGVDRFTYRADDGTATSGLGIVVITVNGRPIAEPDAYTVNVNSTLEVSAPGVLANDSDPEGDELFAMLVEGPDNGTLTPQGIDNLEIAPDGGFIYTPNTDFVGIDSFIYRVSDTNFASSTAEVTIEVQAQCQYTVVGLGTLGGTVSRAVDINNAGEIVGFSETADGSVRGFIWSGGDITTVAPDQINQTFAIDEDIAGTADINGIFQAARFSGIETTPQGPADAFSIAFGTSGSRSVGTYVEDETFRPFINDNGFAALPVPEGHGGRAIDVNSDGVVAGYSLSERALRWELGEVTDLGPGRAYGINDRGQVVGRSSERAVQWEFDGTPTILGDDERFAEAYDNNFNGTVVGSSILVTDTSQTATLRDEEAVRPSSWRTTRDLAQLARLVSHQRTLSSSGASASPKRTPLGAAYRFQFGIASDLNECISPEAGWVLEEARAINDLGQIVGFGLLNERQQAFLLNPERLNAQSNTAPEARQDRIQTTFGEPVDLQFAQERRDANGDSLLLARVFTPEEGTIRQDINGAYQYHPRAGYSGVDRFTYVVTNGKGATAKNTVSVDVSAPDQFVLEANAPNPFRGQTVIRFTLPSNQHVRLDVYDILGRRVASLLDASLPPGQHRTLFDASEMSSGVYFYRIRADGHVETRKMVVVR